MGFKVIETVELRDGKDSLTVLSISDFVDIKALLHGEGATSIAS
jgi:hypothetical protein